MSGANRAPDGGRVNRARPLSFTFDGVKLSGLEGDTLASALLLSTRRSTSAEPPEREIRIARSPLRNPALP